MGLYRAHYASELVSYSDLAVYPDRHEPSQWIEFCQPVSSYKRRVVNAAGDLRSPDQIDQPSICCQRSDARQEVPVASEWLRADGLSGGFQGEIEQCGAVRPPGSRKKNYVKGKPRERLLDELDESNLHRRVFVFVYL
jgi:hypothetical protein